MWPWRFRRCAIPMRFRLRTPTELSAMSQPLLSSWNRPDGLVARLVPGVGLRRRTEFPMPPGEGGAAGAGGDTACARVRSWPTAMLLCGGGQWGRF